MFDPEKSAMNYAMLFPIGIVGMFVAHLLAYVGERAGGASGILLPYWWGYFIVFPALASIWITWKKTFWLGTAIVVCLAPVLYFTWLAANSDHSALGAHPFTILFMTVAVTCVIAYLAGRRSSDPEP